jgi:hypothetical protein
MQVVLNVTLTPDELKTGAVQQARAAAAAAVANAPALDKAVCASDVQATAPSTFAFDLSPPPAAPSA